MGEGVGRAIWTKRNEDEGEELINKITIKL